MLRRELCARDRSLNSPYSHRTLTARVHGACKQKQECYLFINYIAMQRRVVLASRMDSHAHSYATVNVLAQTMAIHHYKALT